MENQKKIVINIEEEINYCNKQIASINNEIVILINEKVELCGEGWATSDRQQMVNNQERIKHINEIELIQNKNNKNNLINKIYFLTTLFNFLTKKSEAKEKIGNDYIPFDFILCKNIQDIIHYILYNPPNLYPNFEKLGVKNIKPIKFIKLYNLNYFF